MAKPLNKILLVDDEEDIRAIMQIALGELGGFTLLCCSSGAEAIRQAEDFQPDLIILDVMMPVLDGPDTLQALRQLPSLKATPCVFATAKTQVNELAQYQAMGIMDVITKPFDPMALATTLTQSWFRHLSQSSASSAQPGMSEGFHDLLREYAQALPHKFAAIEQRWQRLVHQSWEPVAWEAFHREVHSLCGSSGTYGYLTLSRALRDLEIQLSQLKEHAPNMEQRLAISALLDAAKMILDVAAQTPPALGDLKLK